MADAIEIRLTDEFVRDYWFDELDHDETEIPRLQDVMDWIYAHVKSLYFPT